MDTSLQNSLTRGTANEDTFELIKHNQGVNVCLFNIYNGLKYYIHCLHIDVQGLSFTSNIFYRLRLNDGMGSISDEAGK